MDAEPVAARVDELVLAGNEAVLLAAGTGNEPDSEVAELAPESLPAEPVLEEDAADAGVEAGAAGMDAGLTGGGGITNGGGSTGITNGVELAAAAELAALVELAALEELAAAEALDDAVVFGMATKGAGGTAAYRVVVSTA